MVEESGAEKCSETSLSLAADDVFGNYRWYAFKTNDCFRGYVNVATLTFVHNNTECVDLVAPDGLVFFTDGSLCEGRADAMPAGVFFDILNVRDSFALGCHATVFQSEVYAILVCSEYCISEGNRSTEQYINLFL
jgi:hypothetical protein